MSYIVAANTVAGFHTALILYFLFGWLIPFAPLKLRALSAFVIGIIFGFFHFFSVCPLTALEYHFRELAGQPVINRALIDRLSQWSGFSFDATFLNTTSFFVIIGVSVITLVVLMVSIKRKVARRK